MWDLQRDSPPWLLMKGAMGILFCFFQSVFQKSEGKLCSGFANSPCFPFTFIFIIDLLTVVQKYKFFFRSQNVSSASPSC